MKGRQKKFQKIERKEEIRRQQRNKERMTKKNDRKK
jgi:hypothetical protein